MMNPSLAVMDLEPLEVSSHHVSDVTQPPETCHVAAENCFGFCSKSAEPCSSLGPTLAPRGPGQPETENKQSQLSQASPHL